ncbi:MAG: 7-cyano-7-deazaguanine synthase QueC [Deltaproteobacteria bacterium]|nr:7-cyano-7-deazaguanine synthase QueC [Deltaproteobacteria bacterium]
MSNNFKAVVLLSGGLDSATTLAMAQSQGFACHCLSFSYGQRQLIEIEAAKCIAQKLAAIEHRIAKIDLAAFGGSALTDNIAVPKNRSADEIQRDIPVTYVPARNTIFLSHALALAEIIGAYDIFIGVNAIDYSGYPDCRPEFIAAFEKLANIATAAAVLKRGSFTIHAPLINLTKAEIIKRGIELRVDYGMTHSCYDPVGSLACGHCDACQIRLQGFVEAGIVDPIQYAMHSKEYNQ